MIVCCSNLRFFIICVVNHSWTEDFARSCCILCARNKKRAPVNWKKSRSSSGADASSIANSTFVCEAHALCMSFVSPNAARSQRTLSHTCQNTPGHPSLSVFLSGSRCCHPVIILHELETRQCLPGPLRVEHNFRRRRRRCSCVSSSPWVLACSLPASRSSAWINTEVLHNRSVTGGCHWVHAIHISSWMILTEEPWVISPHY